MTHALDLIYIHIKFHPKSCWWLFLVNFFLTKNVTFFLWLFLTVPLQNLCFVYTCAKQNPTKNVDTHVRKKLVDHLTLGSTVIVCELKNRSNFVEVCRNIHLTFDPILIIVFIPFFWTFLSMNSYESLTNEGKTCEYDKKMPHSHIQQTNPWHCKE